MKAFHPFFNNTGGILLPMTGDVIYIGASEGAIMAGAYAAKNPKGVADVLLRAGGLGYEWSKIWGYEVRKWVAFMQRVALI